MKGITCNIKIDLIKTFFLFAKYKIKMKLKDILRNTNMLEGPNGKRFHSYHSQ